MKIYHQPIIPPVDCAPTFAMSEATSDVDALSSAYAWPKRECFLLLKSKKILVSIIGTLREYGI